MLYDDYGDPVDMKMKNAADVVAAASVGGIGALVYHTFRFKEYEYDYAADDTLCLKPLVYDGLEPDVDRANSLSGAELFVALYNLAVRIDSPESKLSFDELMIEFCKRTAHPYFIDEVYEELTDRSFVLKRDGWMVSRDAMFPVDDFKRDIERFYNGARFFFALRQIADGEDIEYLKTAQDGRHFDRLSFFDKYGHPDMPVMEMDGETNDPEKPKDIVDEMRRGSAAYARFVKEHEKELYKYTKEAIDDFEGLRDNLLYLIPDFHMRLKVDPETQKTVFAADIHSVFDIAWYTLARLLVDIRLTDTGAVERRFSEANVGVCKCCGRAFAKDWNHNRKEYCGQPDCQKKRQRERAQKKRQKDKLRAQQEKADTKRKSI